MIYHKSSGCSIVYVGNFRILTYTILSKLFWEDVGTDKPESLFLATAQIFIILDDVNICFGISLYFYFVLSESTIVDILNIQLIFRRSNFDTLQRYIRYYFFLG